MQQWYALSDPEMEEALYEIASMRHFARVWFLEAIPVETTTLNFRRLLERHGLAPKLLEVVNRHLQGKGLLLRQGTIMVATSSRRRVRRRTTAAGAIQRCTRPGRDAGLVHMVISTAANVADVTQVETPLHGKEREV